MRVKHITKICALAAALAAVLSFNHLSHISSKDSEFKFSGDYVQDELLIKFREGTNKSKIESLGVKEQDGESKSIYTVKKGSDQTLEQLYAQLKDDSSVLYVEPNYKVKTTAIPNDSYYGNQWNMQKISAPAAWDKTTGSSSVTIAVLDTGIDYLHEDLAAKIWTNPGETGGGKETNNADDDGNGYIDDWHGYDFINNDNDASDDYNHGTAVAGIAAASTNNGVGIAGTSWGAKVLPLKVLNSSGSGTVAEVIEALEYVRNNHIAIANMSLGTYEFSQMLSDTVDAAYSAGVIMIGASGNDNSPNILYPAKFSKVMAVGGTDLNDNRCDEGDWGAAHGSNYGPELDVVAPGVNIYATDRSGNQGYSSGNYYSSFSGTSAATPQVSGLAALFKSVAPSYSNQQIMDYIKIHANKLSGMGGQSFTNSYGFGRINAQAPLSVYSWQFVALAVSRDPVGLSPGETVTFYLVARNNGSTVWSNSGANPILVGTSGPQDRLSPLYSSGWINAARPARLTEASVAPGGLGTFSWQVTVPARPGAFNERYSLVAEGIAWLNDPGVNYYVTINSNYSWQFVAQAASKDLANLSPGETATFYLVARNTGNTTWYNSGPAPIYVGTTFPRDRFSSLYSSGWANAARPARLTEASVAPGGFGTFSWQATVPYGPAAYLERVSLVAEGIAWMNDPGASYYMTINKAYGWQLVSQTSDKNLAGLLPGETANVTLTARNVGNTKWFRSGRYPMRVGTTWPMDRTSPFADATWINPGRPAGISEGTNEVLPGQTVTFSWVMKAPAAMSVYRDNISLVAEGLGWLNDPGVNFYAIVGYAETLEGVPMPANSGKTAREQHLSLSACQESTVTHYALSSVSAPSQNGMAWQTSGGCGYGAWGSSPYETSGDSTYINDERYYINMRWNYTSLHGQPVYAAKNWYYRKKVLVINPANNRKLVASIIEYGPSPATGRVSGLSPEGMAALGAVTDSTLQYYWVLDQTLPLGLI